MFVGLKRAARAIFVDDVRVKRDEEGLRIVFESGPADSRESPLARAQRLAEDERHRQLLQIREQLGAVFAGMPELRRKLDHLSRVEAALARHGLGFLDTMPLTHLRLALRQFEQTVIDWSPEGLAYLRSRMAVAVRERLPREANDAGDTRAQPIVQEVIGPAPAGEHDDEQGDVQAALLAAYSATPAADSE